MGEIRKTERRQNIKYRVRAKISGTDSRPRLSVFRSNKRIYAQVIDDLKGVTLASAESAPGEKGSKTEIAKKVGLKLAEVAKSKGVDTVVFDRNGYLFHGRVAALADGAREGGLKF